MLTTSNSYHRHSNAAIMIQKSNENNNIITMVGKKVIDADNKWWDDPSARGRIMAREKNMVDIV